MKKNKPIIIFQSISSMRGLMATPLNIKQYMPCIPVFKEIAGTIPEYIDPIDSIAWLNTIIAYTDNENEQRVAKLKLISQLQSTNLARAFLKKWTFFWIFYNQNREKIKLGQMIRPLSLR